MTACLHRGLHVAEAEDLIPRVVDGAREAGSPYYDYLLTGRGAARELLAGWMARSASEVAARRVTVAIADGQLRGGFIAPSGRDLAAARRADSAALVMGVPPDGREAIVVRLRELSGLFPPVDEQSYYLSKIWVGPAFRGQCLGRQLMEGYLETGRQEGFTRFSLDVHADNRRAIGLCERVGFVVEVHTAAPAAGMEYLRMVADPHSAQP